MHREADSGERGAGVLARKRADAGHAISLDERRDLEQRRFAHGANPTSIGAMTAGDMAGAEGDLRRRHCAADGNRERASAGERAADAMFVRNRRRAGDGREPRAARRAWSRSGLEQRERVRVSGLAQHRLDRPALHDHARVHDNDAVAMSGDHCEIVTDQQDRHLRFRLEAVDERENARLHRDVERRGRLIGND